MMRFCTSILLAAVLLPAQQPPVSPERSLDGVATPQKTAGQPGQGSAWFPVLNKDLGTFFHHETAKGTFKFRNPTGKPVEWRSLSPSCACSHAAVRIGDRTYEMSGKPNAGAMFRVKKTAAGEERERINLIQVDAGEEGELDVFLEMTGVTGLKPATLDVHTTDPEAPLIQVKFQATGAQMFVLSPAEVNFNTMTWNESREFTVQVTSPVQKDFNILRMDPVTSDFKVKYEKALKDGVAAWTVSGTYGPLASEIGGGGVLKFYTDLPGAASFQVRVQAFVKGPLEIKPGSFLTLGMIRKGNARTEKVVFEPNDGFNLDAVKITFEKLTVPEQFVTVKTSKDGNKLVVELEIAKDCPAGLVRGDMVVELNHPAIKMKRILFNGYVR